MVLLENRIRFLAKLLVIYFSSKSHSTAFSCRQWFGSKLFRKFPWCGCWLDQVYQNCKRNSYFLNFCSLLAPKILAGFLPSMCRDNFFCSNSVLNVQQKILPYRQTRSSPQFVFQVHVHLLASKVQSTCSVRGKSFDRSLGGKFFFLHWSPHSSQKAMNSFCTGFSIYSNQCFSETARSMSVFRFSKDTFLVLQRYSAK